MDAITSILPSLTTEQQLHLTWLAFALKYGAEFYSAVVGGGGLRRILYRFWAGENLPKPIREDYKQELTTAPFAVTSAPKPPTEDSK